MGQDARQLFQGKGPFVQSAFRKVWRDLFLEKAALHPAPSYSVTIASQPSSPLYSNNIGQMITEKSHIAERGLEKKDPIKNEADRFAYLEAYKPLLEMHLEHSRPYLKKGYSIQDLSDETGIPLHHLTALLNKGYHVRFNDFINKLRLEYLVKNFKPDWERLTLEGIGREVGFNSRTTFYNAIKKNTGFSPSAFFENKKLAFEKTATG